MPDTPDYAAAFANPSTQHGETAYPQVRMLCQMKLTSHLLVQAIMERMVLVRRHSLQR